MVERDPSESNKLHRDSFASSPKKDQTEKDSQLEQSPGTFFNLNSQPSSNMAFKRLVTATFKPISKRKRASANTSPPGHDVNQDESKPPIKQRSDKPTFKKPKVVKLVKNDEDCQGEVVPSAKQQLRPKSAIKKGTTTSKCPPPQGGLDDVNTFGGMMAKYQEETKQRERESSLSGDHAVVPPS